MRQVVERVTCDIGGEYGFSDSGTFTVSQKEFTWGHKTYTFDCCAKCEQVVGTWTVNALIEKANPVVKASRPNKSGQTRNRRPSTSGVKHVGDLGDFVPNGPGGTSPCPATGCKHVAPTMRGLKMHWTSQQNAEQMSKAS